MKREGESGCSRVHCVILYLKTVKGIHLGTE